MNNEQKLSGEDVDAVKRSIEMDTEEDKDAQTGAPWKDLRSIQWKAKQLVQLTPRSRRLNDVI